MAVPRTRILVIGGAGYIGSHIVKKLSDESYDVTVFDNLSSGQKVNINKRAKFIEGDIRNKKDLDKTFSKGFDCVMHFAALKDVGESMLNPEKYSENNIVGSINILDSMTRHGIRNIVFSSSAAVYGTPEYIPLDESHPKNPTNYYGFTKYLIENILEWYSRLKRINYAALRYFNAAGYGTIRGREKNPSNLLPIVMEVATGKRKSMQVYGNDYDTKDGTGIRDYIHVQDLADAHLLALKYISENRNLIINLASGKGYSVIEVIQMAKKITGKKIHYEVVARRAGDPAIVIASGELAYKILGWKPKYSELDNIIKTMWDAYKKPSS